LTTIQYWWQVYDTRCGKQQWSCIVVMLMVASSTTHISIWENPWGGGNLVFSLRWKEFPSLSRKDSLISSYVIFDAGLSWVPQ
jgi:hypothetical protein